MASPHSPRPGAAGSSNGRRNKYRDRQAVYLIQAPNDWKPQRPWDVPPGFTSGVLHARNLSMRDALGFCRAHNKTALEAYQHGDRSQPWAILAKFTRQRRWWPTRGRGDDLDVTLDPGWEGGVA